jgi:uncharacterized protein YkwD
MTRGTGRKWLSLALVGMAAAAFALVSSPYPTSLTSAQALGASAASLPPAAEQQPLLDSEEQAFVELINAYRSENGVPSLSSSPALNSAARWMSEDMAANDRFDHTDSLGRNLLERTADFGYNYNTWKGENLAAGTDTATYAFETWRDSPAHDSNMLDPNFVAIGVARAYDSHSTYGWYWTTDFGGFNDELASDGASLGSAPPASPDLVTVAVTGEPQDGLEVAGAVDLVTGWNYACYGGDQQDIDIALASIMSQVLAVYRLRDDGGYDRWFPDRPDVSTITAVDPFESVFVLMSGDASWVQDASAASPASADLVMGWNSVCYGGLTEPVNEAAASMGASLDILYSFDSGQVWRRYVLGRPEITTISDLAHLTSVLALVTEQEGATWAFDLTR